MATPRLRALTRSAADAADLLQDCCPALRTPPLQAGAILAATAALLEEITGHGPGGSGEGGDTGAREPDDPGAMAEALCARIAELRGAGTGLHGETRNTIAPGEFNDAAPGAEEDI